MKVKTSTNLIPVINCNSYEAWMYDQFVCGPEDIEKSIVECAPSIVEEAIRDVCPSAQVSNPEAYMPREYNFNGDELNFDLTISDNDYNAMLDRCVNDPEFDSFLYKNYKSYDGFISYMADCLDEFYNQEDTYKVAQMIMFLFDDGDSARWLQEDYEDAVRDFLFDNCPPVEDDIDLNYNGASLMIYADYNTDPISFALYADDEELQSFQASDYGTQAAWDAYNEAYRYAESIAN